MASHHAPVGWRSVARGATAVTTTITDTDRGLQAVTRALRELEKLEVVVGILASSGSKMVMVASVHEFGAPSAGIPQRSWLRGFVSENAAQIADWRRAMVASVRSGKVPARRAMERFGAQIAGGIQKRIASSIAPPNAEATVAHKGSDTTLVDTGAFRSSVTWQIRTRGPE